MRRRFQVTPFVRALLAIALVALAVRLTYVLWGKSGECLVTDPETSEVISSPTACPGPGEGRANDAVYYNAAANHLARGGGLTDPFHPDMPAADHPPMTVFVLAPVSWIGDHVVPAALLDDLTNVFLHRLAMAGFGTLVVIGIGLVGRRLASRTDRPTGDPADAEADRVGLIAAAIAAVYPGLWISDALIFAETIANLFVVAALGLALLARRSPTPRTLVALGAAVALCALTRAELALFGPLFALIVVPWRSPARVRAFAALVAGAVVLVGPWVIYNNLRFDEPTLISTNDGLAIAASNCREVYYGDGIGLTSYIAGDGFDACIEVPGPAVDPALVDQSVVSRIHRDRAIGVIRDHLTRQPAVMAARVGRVWNVFRPFDMVVYNQGEDRESWATRAAIWSFYPVAILAVVGAVRLRRRALDRLLVVLVPVVTVTIGAALTYGQARYRAPAEPSLVLLAAVAIGAWATRGRRRPDEAPGSATEAP